jgi:hypothetical protein
LPRGCTSRPEISSGGQINPIIHAEIALSFSKLEALEDV